MAITKILYRNGGLRQAIDYITNPAKTNEQLLTDYVRCDPGHAAQQMMDTKRALGKTAGRQCYHIIQSFKPDEITPELAHEIARQFAAEHLPGYEAVIATHVDKTHITTADDLTACLQQAENEVTQLAKQRTILNVRKKKHKKLFDALAAEAAFAGFEPRKAEYDDAKEVLDTCGIPREALLAEKADLCEQLAQVNQQLRQERWKLKQCKEISETAVIMQRDIDRVEQQPQRIADTHQR